MGFQFLGSLIMLVAILFKQKKKVIIYHKKQIQQLLIIRLYENNKIIYSNLYFNFLKQLENEQIKTKQVYLSTKFYRNYCLQFNHENTPNWACSPTTGLMQRTVASQKETQFPVCFFNSHQTSQVLCCCFPFSAQKGIGQSIKGRVRRL